MALAFFFFLACRKPWTKNNLLQEEKAQSRHRHRCLSRTPWVVVVAENEIPLDALPSAQPKHWERSSV